ncbi:cation diffusion facilitator family transporter [Methylacidiphilum caldifontis]|uniref:Cobalt transporter n=1 Tax=Methylacidiphilum caldifontis TaxID=2795386 RepID=A0A4Y8PB49_9BACT|nr:cation diffusion facilitator family transporter [Methylacidiphilum caldifontis]QSR88172.1 cation transporter [Methylacidiphilum caldifontis]TFE68210.1 cobalt transporter [Methylacidiphilum caldifontis]
MSSSLDQRIFRYILLSLLLNFIFAATKISVGLIGHSSALIADGIESVADIGSSILVWLGIKISQMPPDFNHPFGHGKADPISALIISTLLIFLTFFVSYEAIKSLWQPSALPSVYTLPILVLVIISKEFFFRIFRKLAKKTDSLVLLTNSWHHRYDAFSSLAAFLGILVALITGWKLADALAALVSGAIILWNSIQLLHPSFLEIMDTAPPKNIELQIRNLAKEVPGVINIEKCRIRKSGQGLLMDIHVVVSGSITVREGHTIGHKVKEKLCSADSVKITDVVVHVEPVD